MTDANPRIFRNLEKSGGRESFDDIVLAAVADFAARDRPSPSQVRDFGRLAASLYDRTALDTRRAVALTLAANAAVPRALVDRLLAEPVAVVAPFLAASPALTPDDLATLSTRREAGLKKLLKARLAPARSEKPAPSRRRKAKAAPPDAAAPKASPPRRLSAARQTALLSAGTPAPETADAAPARSVAEPKTAEEALLMLRRLVRPGAAPAKPVATSTPPKRADLLALALERDVEGFHALLANRLLLTLEQAETIRLDASGRELAIALKAAGTERADALTMLMMLNGALGSDVTAFEAMGAFYGSLDYRDCAQRFEAGDPAARPVLRSPYADTEAPVRPEARRVFGRRTSLPAGIERRRRES